MAKVKQKNSKMPAKKAVKKASAKKSVSKAKAKSSAKKVSISSATKKKKATKKRKPETLMCFLTTACVNHYSLPDNCYELTTLRNYRDGYLASSPGGRALVKDYYAIAPKIVVQANKDKDKNSVYEYIFTQVKRACEEIEKKNLTGAKNTYVNLVTLLMKRYHLSGVV